MESEAPERKGKRKNEKETSSSTCKRRRNSGVFRGNVSEQEFQENKKEAFTETNKDWRRLSFVEESIEAGGYNYIEDDNSGMRIESAGVDKKVNRIHGRRRRSTALSEELDESISSSNRNVADSEALSLPAKRKYGTISGLESLDHGRGSSRKRLKSSDNGRVRDKDQESATSSNGRHQEDGNVKIRELGLPAETPVSQWRRFRGIKNLGMSIEPYEAELKSTERYTSMLLTVMVGSAAAAQDPLQLSKKKLKITSTPTVTTGNAATKAIQVPLDDIRAIQILPQPPIDPKFYSDRCARTELETWLWHPTDGTRALIWEKAQSGIWSLDCDGGFRKGAYGRYGSVIRNHEGREEVFVYGMSPVIMSPLFHELESIFETTKVAWSLGKKKISIRTDSKRAAHLLTMRNVYSTPDEGYHVWNIVEKLKQYFWHNYRKEDGCSVHVRHQYRELNNLGDYVAGLATETTPTVVFGSFDDTTRFFLDWDIAGLPYYWDRDRKKAEKKMREESLHK